MIIAEIDAQPTVAVKNLDRAKAFYGNVLGLKPVGPANMGPVQTFLAGRTVLVVYESQFAGTNQATSLTFDVDDVEKEVGELKEKGIFFEKYDLPGLQPQGDFYVGEKGFKTAWFKDPDGNILNIING